MSCYPTKFLYLSKMNHRDKPVVDFDRSTVAKDVRYHLYLPEQMHQDCDLQPYQEDCGECLYFLHYPNLHVVDNPELVYADATGGDMMVYVDYSGDDGGDSSDCNSDHNSMDSPNHNTSSSSIYMENSNSSMVNPNHNTSYTMVQLLHPKCQTSMLHTLARPIPYRPTRRHYRMPDRMPRRSETHLSSAKCSMTTAYDRLAMKMHINDERMHFRNHRPIQHRNH